MAGHQRCGNHLVYQYELWKRKENRNKQKGLKSFEDVLLKIEKICPSAWIGLHTLYAVCVFEVLTFPCRIANFRNIGLPFEAAHWLILGTALRHLFVTASSDPEVSFYMPSLMKHGGVT